MQVLAPMPRSQSSRAFSWSVPSVPPLSFLRPHQPPSQTSFAAFGGILFGYDTGTISGIKEMKDWLRTFGSPTTDLVTYPKGYYITSSQESLVVSILSAGTFFGQFIYLFIPILFDLTFTLA